MKVKQLKYYLDDLSKRIKDFDDYDIEVLTSDETGRYSDLLEQIQVLDNKIALYGYDDCYLGKKGIKGIDPVIDEKGDNYYK